MATVKKLRGRWQCAVRRKGFPHQYKVFNTEQEAAEWGDQIEEAMRAGTFSDKPRVLPPRTIREMLDRYFKEVSPLKSRGDRDDRARIERLKRVLGAYTVHNLTSLRLSQYKKDRLLEGAAPQTVLHELVLISASYTQAIQEWGLELKGPPPRTKRPPLNNARNFRIPHLIMELIQGETGSRELPDLMELAIETCMRRSELLRFLRPQFISLAARTVFLPHTKNGEARVVPLTSRAIEILRPRIEAKVDPLYSIQPDSLTRAFKRAATRVGYDHLRFHDTRHEGISRLFERGYSVLEASRISGHKTLSQLDRYAHLDVKHLIEKMAMIEEADAEV